MTTAAPYGEQVSWQPATPRLRPLRLLISWVVAAASIWVAAAVVPGVGARADRRRVRRRGAASRSSTRCCRRCWPRCACRSCSSPASCSSCSPTRSLLVIAHEVLPDDIHVDSFGDALLAALVMAAVSVVLQAILGTNDDDEYSLQVTRRIARRQGAQERTDVPGIIFLEIDGLALPVLRDAMRDGSAPTMARWIAEDGYQLAEWETDLSSQTGASQAGILLGSNEDIPAFRWVEKERGRMMVCSSPADCAEIERRHATGVGLLVDGGASRGNLLSGEAEEAILTVSRSEAERKANPGYRAFLANGFNVTRALVLFLWEIVLELTAAARAARRDVRPRGHRGGIYPLMRGGDVRDRPRPHRLRRPHRHDARAPRRVRDLLQLRRGRPPLGPRARRHDGGAAQARRAVRPHRAGAAATRRAPTRSSSSPTTDRRRAPPSSSATATGSTSSSSARSSRGRVSGFAGGDEQNAMVQHAVSEATGDEGEAQAEERRLRARRRRPGLGQPRARLPDGDRPPAHRRGDRRAPSRAHPGAARAPPHRLAARPLGRARRRRPRAATASATSTRAGSRASTRSRTSRPPRRATCCAPTASRTSPTSWSAASTTRCSTRAARSRSSSRSTAASAARRRAPSSSPPPRLPLPDEPIIGAAAVHGVLSGWRRLLQGPPAEQARLAGAPPGGGQQLGSELAESGGGDEVAGEQPAATP